MRARDWLQPYGLKSAHGTVGHRTWTSRTRARWALTIALLSLATFAHAQPPAAPSPSSQSPAEVASSLHHRGGYDDEVSYDNGNGAQETFPPSGESGANARRDGQRGQGAASPYTRGNDGLRTPSASSGGMHAVGSAASTLISYGVLILLMLLLAVGAAFAIMQAIRNRKGEDAAPPPLVVTTARPIGPSKALDFDADDPDALAAAGRYAEAVLALLVRCLKSAGWQRHEVGRTAREVLHATSHSAKGALRTVVLGAERIQFGGQDASKAIYDDLRAAAAPLLMS